MENNHSSRFNHIVCPVCGNNSFDLVLEFTPEVFLNEERKKYYNLEALGLEMTTKFTIKKCQKCGFVLVNPRLKKDLYDIVYNEAKAGQYEMKNWMFEKSDVGRLFGTFNKYRETMPLLNILVNFRDHFKKPKNEGYSQLRLLDYGCGHGHILDLCRTFEIDAVGVEIDRRRLEICRKKGLNAITPPELPETEKFNMAISTSVIEHVDDLNAYFDYIAKRLVRSGYFYFNGLTPKIIDLEKRKSDYKLVMPLEHINYFTRSALMRLAKKHGFEEAGGHRGVFATERLVDYSIPFLKKYVFKGFYPTGNFEVMLRKIN